ncbi:unnamed protein product [Phytomonas sp. Hart1]|nr:unnamed protein product [Phytomonas sp. Hart1]|eukprot:CCW66617.1 unnamed protein product [Phytomonas sp. isolate Hart1]
MKKLQRNVQMLWQILKRTIVDGVRFSRTALRSLYLPDETSLYTDTFIRLIFGMYYISAIVMTLAMTHNALQQVVWSLVFPVTQEMEKYSYNFSSTWTLMLGLCDIFRRVAPFTALGISIATVGHKMINCIAEAMLDSYTKHQGIDYPLTRASLQFVLKKPARLAALLGVMPAFSCLIIFIFYTSIIEFLVRKETEVVIATFVVGIVQVMFVGLTLPRRTQPRLIDAQKPQQTLPCAKEGCCACQLDAPETSSLFRGKHGGNGHVFDKSELKRETLKQRSSEVATVGQSNHKTNGHLRGAEGSQYQPLGRKTENGEIQNDNCFVNMEDEWWTEHIRIIRYNAFVLVMFFSVTVGILYGPLRSLTTAVLMIMCLNFPHLFAYMSLSFTSATIRTLCSYRWLVRHPDAHFPVLIVIMPYGIMLLSGLLYFHNHIFTCVILLGVNVLLVARGIDLVREFEMTENGSVHWVDISLQDREKLLQPSLAILLEDAYERDDKQIGIVSLDMSFDMDNMLIKYSNGTEIQISRKQIIPNGAARRLTRIREFYFYVLPRLLSLQSQCYFVGSTFRTARIILRAVYITILILFAFIVSGMLVQAAFPELRPIPVRARASHGGRLLTFDHIVVHMHLLSRSNVTCETDDAMRAMHTAKLSNFKWLKPTSNDNEDLYPYLCTRDYYGTSVWELALLALAPYLSSTEEIGTMLNYMNTNMGSDWVVQPRYGTACVPTNSNHKPTGWTGFYDFYSISRNMSVIAVRGTDLFSFTDFLIDIDLFFETVLYQFMTMVVPGSVVVPKELVVNLIRLVSLQEKLWSPIDTPSHVEPSSEETWAHLLNSTNKSLRECKYNNYHRNFYADVYNHLVFRGLQPDHPKHVVLTGHSLGGAVAAILAAQLDIKAVAFSAPGILLGRKKFDVNLRLINKNVMTVISSGDIVPKLGQHGGEVHHVECLASTTELCHAMEFLIGTLWRSCASLRAKYPLIQRVV